MRAPRHWLFLAFGALSVLGAPFARGAEDRVTMNDGRTQEGKITGVANGGIEIEIKLPNGSPGKIGLPLAGVTTVSMEIPASARTGLAAYESGDFARALSDLRPLAERFRGLPSDWARRVASVMGDVFLETNDLPHAEAAYADFSRLYPGGKSTLRGSVGLARIALAKGDRARARQILDPMAKAALGDASPAEADAAVYGQTFLLLGQILEAEKDYPSALHDYLRTVTLFYQDRAAASAAQKAADALRQAQKIAVP